jgi:peptide/nickel transport system ATP-binding protein
LRLALADEAVDVERLQEQLVGAEGRLETVLRERYGIPKPLSDADAERALSVALEALATGNDETALDRLGTAFASPCERHNPSFHETVVGESACHRCDEATQF